MHISFYWNILKDMENYRQPQTEVPSGTHAQASWKPYFTVLNRAFFQKSESELANFTGTEFSSMKKKKRGKKKRKIARARDSHENKI